MLSSVMRVKRPKNGLGKSHGCSSSGSTGLARPHYLVGTQLIVSVFGCKGNQIRVASWRFWIRAERRSENL
jgi:hypothetical protein